MKLLLDTNILVSCLITKSRSATMNALLDLPSKYSGVRLVVARETLDELLAVVSSKPYLKRTISVDYLEEFLDTFLDSVMLIDIDTSQSAERFTANPKDDYLISAMIRADLDVLVSGDRHLLDLDGQFQFPILSPADAVQFAGALYD